MSQPTTNPVPQGVPDVLGPEYTAITLPLGQDEEGDVVATLVRRRAPVDHGRAVLHLHGYTDYFFQAHVADFYVDRGYHFYALDLRKCGRSLRDYQTPNFCHSLTDYIPELDRAVDIIRRQDGVDTLVLEGHSTGGLLAALWAHRVRGRGVVDGVVLNSPYFDQNVAPGLRPALDPLLSMLAARTPKARLPIGMREGYGQSIHVDDHGEWNYDLTLKPHGGFPIRLGWLAAVLRAQSVVRHGLAIDVPVLVLASSRSRRSPRYSEEGRAADTVLNVAHMARIAPRLGKDVTYATVEGGMHDVTLSDPAAREIAFTELADWLDRHYTSTEAPTPPHA
ncbi:alpha/beta hydrolase [Spiractinospora alimapuensis]|uniref:alpha/beta hydrolase n=1 Tax=Spiractinospora alimapuensis TaxID=2820884 RepID=UPI001F1A2089|nr:alpha/beta hydrolase [Spiractinospora alimapuensis]